MPASLPSSLQVRRLRKSYGEVVAVDGLDLEVFAGECFGLLGPNGAGKTTTIEICEGLTTPDEGDVVVLGRRWGRHDRELRELLGISLQETQFAEKLTVEETVRLFRSFYRNGPTPEAIIRMVQLQEKAHARVGGLS
ncbi:MAG TPA: ATP-binding cassette domain-containing protein, partial [Gemmatimonadales bacterium]|nr:ATP-binding cassette domain-containing protein [Gemmatimonadales bacterium]